MIKSVIATLAFLGIVLIGGAVASEPSTSSKDDSLKLRVVPMSALQWKTIQGQVNTNGWSHIKEQNVLLVITNGCPIDIEHFLPMILQKPVIDLERNPLRTSGKRGKGNKKHDSKEPLPYVGQML